MESIRLSSVVPISESNGPGPHYTIWVQGCNLRCPGCFNRHTHDPNGGYSQPISVLIKQIALLWYRNEIVGVTITGGEPFLQLRSVITLLKGIKAIGNIGTIVLTGFTHEQSQNRREFNSLKQFTDVLIAGPYQQDLKLQEGIRGSLNKELIFFTNHYSKMEFSKIPPIEVFVDQEGSISITGIKPEILDEISK